MRGEGGRGGRRREKGEGVTYFVVGLASWRYN